MADQQIQNNFFDDLDEVLVKEPDGTFRVAKVAAAPAVPTKLEPSRPETPLPAVVSKPALPVAVLDADEEKEVAVITAKSIIASPTEKDPAEDLARRALTESGITLSDATLQSRLTMTMIAYVKQIRNDLETRTLLMREKDKGGLAMTMSEATRLLSFLKTGGKESPQAQKPITPPPSTNPPAGGVVTGQVPVPKPVVPLPSAPKPITSPLPTTAKPSPQPVVTPKPVAPRVEVQRPLAVKDVKPVVQDITFTPTLVGPVEELRMRIADWRRMAPTIADRGKKIEDKLQLLQEQGYTERMKGVAAWYESEVVRTYQEIGMESLTLGKPVAALITEREAAQRPGISFEEFQYVAELNERLRF